MRYLEHPPALPLSSLVACYWTLDGALTREPRSFRVLPDACMDLVFVLGGGPAEVIGVMTRAVVTTAVPGQSLLGVRFQPGGAFELLRSLPARELRDRAASLSDVWGAAGRELAERVGEAKGAEEAMRILDRELLARSLRATPDSRVRALVGAIRAARGGLPVSALAARARIGERQLERLFDEKVGLGPKALARVVRMQAVLATDPALGWSAVAAQTGYADQAHLVRDFRALAGVTPGELQASRLASQQMSDSFNPPRGPLVNMAT